jgi:hypothetical protein
MPSGKKAGRTNLSATRSRARTTAGHNRKVAGSDAADGVVVAAGVLMRGS